MKITELGSQLKSNFFNTRIGRYGLAGATVLGLAAGGYRANQISSRVDAASPVRSGVEALQTQAEDKPYLPLPPYMRYYSELTNTIDADNTTTIQLPKGHIAVFLTQKLDLSTKQSFQSFTNPSNKPDETIVIAVGAIDDVAITFRTFKGITTWSGRESTPRLDPASVAQDTNTAAEAQATRAFVDGNCDTDGCQAALAVSLLARQTPAGTQMDVIGSRRISQQDFQNNRVRLPLVRRQS